MDNDPAGQAARQALRDHRGNHAAGVRRPQRAARQGAAAQGPGRRGEYHRRRRRASASGRGDGGGDAGRGRGSSRCCSSPAATATASPCRAICSARRPRGVRNLLMLRGDDPSAGDQPDAKPVFDLDPRSLLGDRAPPARYRRIAVGAQGFRPRRFLPRRRRQSDRSAARLAAERAASQDRRRRAIRADAILHGCGRGAPLRRAAGRARHHRQAVAHRRHRAAALGQVGALDQGKIVRRHYPGRRSSSAWKAPAIRRRKAAASASISRASSPTSRRSPACHIMAPGNDAVVPDIIKAARETIARLAAV